MSQAHGRLLARDAMAFVLAGGRGSRLKELTDECAKPAVHFGGGLRIIDFALSNAINSGIRRIAVATQYKQSSLIHHIERASRVVSPERDESFDVLPGAQDAFGTPRYRSTADAVLQNIDVIERYAPKYIVVLAGDHIYKMDYEVMLRQHVDSGADVTVGCLVVPRKEASGFGVMHVDERDNITAFVEKPADPPAIPGVPDYALASMGIYVFDRAFLFDVLRRDACDPQSTHDFGGDIIPHVVKYGKAVAHRFSASCIGTTQEVGEYWRDVGTLDAYFDANLDVASCVPRFDMRDHKWPIWTDRLNVAVAERARKEKRCLEKVISSLVSKDCVVSGANIERSLLFSGVGVGNGSRVDEAVILPNCNVGSGARLNRVIVDSGVCIPAGLVVGEDPDFDARHFRRTENGVCLVTQRMIDQLAELLPIRSAA